MKSILSALLLAGICQPVLGADGSVRPGTRAAPPLASFEVARLPFGSGTPANNVTSGTEAAQLVGDELYHVPNYMPGFPTAATIWPREVPLDCETSPAGGEPVCSGFQVHPSTGRGEYIFVRPYIKPAPVVYAPPPPPLPVIPKKPLE